MLSFPAMESEAPPPGRWLPPQPPDAEPDVMPRPEAPPAYGGPVPPGGWQHEPPTPSDAWAGRPLAGWWSRVGATVLDILIIFVPVVAIGGGALAVAANGAGAVEVIAWIVAGLVYLAGLTLYAPLLMARGGERNGQTWGRQIVGIRVVRDNGKQFGFGMAFVRETVVKWLLFGTVGGFFLLPTVLDWLWPLWDGENRALHDFIVSTHVVSA
jgi:uncharacterized RDD family membrane protein YckC